MLTPQEMLAARVIDCLTDLSPASLEDLRRGRRLGQWSLIPRTHLRELYEALEAAHPGVLDAAIALNAERKKGTHP
jgi:hypothetical protein